MVTLRILSLSYFFAKASLPTAGAPKVTTSICSGGTPISTSLAASKTETAPPRLCPVMHIRLSGCARSSSRSSSPTVHPFTLFVKKAVWVYALKPLCTNGSFELIVFLDASASNSSGVVPPKGIFVRDRSFSISFQLVVPITESIYCALSPGTSRRTRKYLASALSVFSRKGFMFQPLASSSLLAICPSLSL